MNCKRLQFMYLLVFTLDSFLPHHYCNKKRWCWPPNRPFSANLIPPRDYHKIPTQGTCNRLQTNNLTAMVKAPDSAPKNKIKVSAPLTARATRPSDRNLNNSIKAAVDQRAIGKYARATIIIHSNIRHILMQAKKTDLLITKTWYKPPLGNQEYGALKSLLFGVFLNQINLRQNVAQTLCSL